MEKIEQVLFRDNEGDIFGGLLIDEAWVVCGECGAINPVDKVKIVTRLPWADISDAIGGDELYVVLDNNCDYETGYDPYTGCFSDDC